MLQKRTKYAYRKEDEVKGGKNREKKRIERKVAKLFYIWIKHGIQNLSQAQCMIALIPTMER